MKIRLFIILIGSLLQGCSQVDDYMLGKDNTPKPKDLKQIDSKVKLSQNWSVPVGKASKTNEYLKIKPVIRGDIIYTADASGLIKAVTIKDGKVQWTTQLKHGIVLIRFGGTGTTTPGNWQYSAGC